ncbi:mechanosensitive ion channel family protein [Pseudalkalibacillus berkeleyi]|uniref:Mechanosensitive ion channel n=1 Tax=Pseudalkalibacillus berkeleyi TaxID=1069813 RepID=A0ABS9H341_9BACL|nr:mechanosensitive ion channel domain-containing protein [Pseudalkalibacillus berkeleyi]MCF6138491.1 mechanosensitive ion channel [Pseudalkalibacillus berkeleyi]
MLDYGVNIIEDWDGFVAQFNWVDSVIFFGFVLLMFFIRTVAFILLHKMEGKSERFQNRLGPALKSITNWITTYGIIVFLLVYFSEASWMFGSIFSIGKVDVSFFLILLAVLIISFANRTSKVMTQFLLPNVYDRYQLDRGLRFTFNRIFHYVIMVFAILISFTTVGIDMSALTVFAGVLGVGIGFGMQNIASNFISGLIILFERPIKVGDRVIINDVIGDIEKINMRATIIKTLDNERIIMPNSYFLEEEVVNRSYGDPRLRLVIPIGVAYGSDVEQVREVLHQAAHEEYEASDVVLNNPPSYVNFTGFGDSSLDFELFVWISNPEFVIQIKSNLNFRIYHLLNENNIEIPFPQRDLHVRSVDQRVIASYRDDVSE